LGKAARRYVAYLAGTTLPEFAALRYDQRLPVTYGMGPYLTTRLERDYVAVNLHYLGRGLFAELYCNMVARQVTLVRGFTDQESLTGSAISMTLPEWVPVAE
jgi:hypothetical protein